MSPSVIHPYRIIITALLAAALLSSCGEESNPDIEKKTFTSIFDNKEFSATFYPIDLRQTPDGGYLVLAERKIPGSNFRGVYLLKADEFGNFVNDVKIGRAHV